MKDFFSDILCVELRVSIEIDDFTLWGLTEKILPIRYLAHGLGFELAFQGDSLNRLTLFLAVRAAQYLRIFGAWATITHDLNFLMMMGSLHLL